MSEHYQQGVIASLALGHAQLDFLSQQLATATAERRAGQRRALILVTHHPPFTASPDHVPSEAMLTMIDQACQSAGIWPDLHLSGHAHLYERYTRRVAGRDIPYLVAGMSGFYNLAGLKPGATPNQVTPALGQDSAGNPLSLDCYLDAAFGYLRLTVSATTLTSTFVTVNTTTAATGVGDAFSLDLQAGNVTTGAAKGSATNPLKPSSRTTAKVGKATRLGKRG